MKHRATLTACINIVQGLSLLGVMFYVIKIQHPELVWIGLVGAVLIARGIITLPEKKPIVSGQAQSHCTIEIIKQIKEHSQLEGTYENKKMLGL